MSGDTKLPELPPIRLEAAQAQAKFIHDGQVIARDIGWLRASVVAIWALLSHQEKPEVIADEFPVEFERVVSRLERMVIGVDEDGSD